MPLISPRTLLLVFCVGVGCATTTTSPPAPVSPSPGKEGGGCDVQGAGGWEACSGQEVQVQGREPEMVYAHPIVAMEQTYLEIGDRQIIVAPVTMVTCPGPMTVRGRLEPIDLGGEPGTRGAYTGWVIQAATITCD